MPQRKPSDTATTIRRRVWPEQQDLRRQDGERLQWGVSFSASGLPPGASASFSPAMVSGSGSTTLTVTTGSSTPPGTYTLTIAGSSGSLSCQSTAGLTVNTPWTSSSLFLASDVPAIVTVNDPNPVELGVKFTASTAGNITALRFYKGPQNTARFSRRQRLHIREQPANQPHCFALNLVKRSGLSFLPTLGLWEDVITYASCRETF